MPEYRDLDMSRLPLTADLGSHDNGFHVNLLANSLSSKLKIQRRGESRTQHERHNTKSAANGDVVATRVSKSILARQEKRRQSQQAVRSALSSNRPDSGSSSRRLNRPSSRGSDLLPELNFDTKRTTPSRRSNSASPVTSTARFTRRPVKYVTPSERTQSELAFMCSRSTSEASGLAFTFESRRPGRSVMMVKRDGVFQPLDKYAPPRQEMREAVPARKSTGACEYEMYQLSCDGSESDGNRTPRFQDEGKRGLKVSWSKTMTDAEVIDSDVDGQGEERTMQLTPASGIRRALSVDNFAFRRPVYSSGRSKVSSIGVKWTVPNVAKDEEKPSKTDEPPPMEEERNTKPMWSYLVTNDTTSLSRNQISPKKTQNGHSSPPSGSQSGKSFSSASRSTTRKHRRDVHPVSTAMDRQGTSVSKTKWKVPSSTSSTLEAERAIMGRLELVHRPGSRLLYDCAPTIRGPVVTDQTISRRAQDLMTQNTERSNRNGQRSDQRYGGDEDGEEEDEMEGVEDERNVERDEDASTYSESERQDITPSPTKSRMTS